MVKRQSSLGYISEDQEGVIEMSFDWTPEELQKVVDENKIVIFMKGTPTNHNVDSQQEEPK